MIVIDSEFAITNAADEQRDRAEREQEVLKEVEELSVSFASDFACPCPVFTCVCGGRIVRIWATSCAGLTPGFALARIWSSLPIRSKEPLPVG